MVGARLRLRRGRPPTVGLRTMSRIERKAYHIFKGQEGREGVKYSWPDFRDWYVREFTKKKWKRAHVARFDHDKPYSFDNIEMQEQAENNRERNERRGNPCRSHKAVAAINKKGEVIGSFRSKVEAAKAFGIDPKAIWNKCNKRTEDFSIVGPESALREVTFRWI